MEPVRLGRGDRVGETVWDLFLCASGYETRATQLAKQLRPSANRKVALAFKEHSGNKVRLANDLWFERNNYELPAVSGDTEADAYSVFIEAIGKLPPRASVLVDISSMTRTW